MVTEIEAHARPKTRLLLALILSSAIAIPAAAQEGCKGFAWPLETEIGWMLSPAGTSIGSGERLPAPAASAFDLKLAPSNDAKLPFKSTAKTIAPDSYSGWFAIDGLPKDGLYQISISSHAWIDAVQNGEPAQTHAFTGFPTCKLIRKSVRYKLAASPITIQIAGSPTETIKVAIREAN
jgi:hypothetical protein